MEDYRSWDADVGSAQRVPAETRLTVYRRLDICEVPAHLRARLHSGLIRYCFGMAIVR